LTLPGCLPTLVVGRSPISVIKAIKRFALQLVTGSFFLFTSAFCFAALNSYTYLFLVKAPPYLWLDWFSLHSSILYWVAVTAATLLRWRQRDDLAISAAWVGQVAIGIGFSWIGGAANIHNDHTAFFWALAILVPELVSIAQDTVLRERKRILRESGNHFSYSRAAMIAIAVTAISLAGVLLRNNSLNIPTAFRLKQAEATLFTVAEYVWLAILLTTVLNLMQLFATRIKQESLIRPWAVLALAFVVLEVSVVRFLTGALSIEGWQAGIYATLLSVFIVIWVYNLGGWVFLSQDNSQAARSRVSRTLAFCGLLVILSVAFVLITAWLTVQDWNGLIVNSFCLLFLMLFSVTLYSLRPSTARYSLPGMLGVILISGFVYVMMCQTAFLWATQLGTTDDDVSLALQQMRDDNDSWQLVDAAFRYHAVTCDALCKSLRQYTNIRNIHIHQQLRLVDNLTPTTGPRPNIFIFTIDSMRRDYLGAYNPAVDFTPNLDLLAHDSVVMQNAFTQYAGTSLSEPAIWAGGLLLHAHYVQPFNNVNNLLALGRTDGYDIAVSYDSILQKIMTSEHLTTFDAEKPFMLMEITSTLQELTHWMDTRADRDRPILFYTQPMNIHILGRNNLPARTAQNWRSRPGFDDRIAYNLHQVDEAMGVFIRYLKQRGLYKESIIVLTSDHGDALPGLPTLGPWGRRGHSLILFPEVMRVPLIVHLPRSLRQGLVWDENRLATQTDITPSLYYLLGHRPINHGFVYGQPLVFATRNEMAQYKRDHLLLASDAAAEYGILSGQGQYLYTVYDSPRETLLFDLKRDPQGKTNYATDLSSRRYDQQILNDLASIAKFYGYRPTGGSSGEFAFDSRD
jgi:arylsulfatase A-like enzyme